MQWISIVANMKQIKRTNSFISSIESEKNHGDIFVKKNQLKFMIFSIRFHRIVGII